MISMILAAACTVPCASAVDFEKEIKPILERRCAKCHAYGKRQAGLSMETRDSLLKGGDNGKVVAAGKTDGSLFLELLEEEARQPPESDDDDDDDDEYAEVYEEYYDPIVYVDPIGYWSPWYDPYYCPVYDPWYW